MISRSEEKPVPAQRGQSRQMRIGIIAVILAVMMVIPVAALVSALPEAALSEPSPGAASDDSLASSALSDAGITSSSSPRSVDYRWYDMFNVPLGQWYNYRLGEMPVTHSPL